MSRILHGKIIPELNPKPRVHKSANPYVVSLPTAILQCDILYNNDIYININEGGGSGSGSNAHLWTLRAYKENYLRRLQTECGEVSSGLDEAETKNGRKNTS